MTEQKSPWEQNYYDAGFSCFPLRAKSKKAAILWREYQSRKPTEDEITQWAVSAAGYNIGNVTGAISGIVVLDLDSADAVQKAKRLGLPYTISACTPRGRHLYFQHPGFSVANIVGADKEGAKLPKGLDLRGDGGYVVAPGSHYVPTEEERADGKVEGSYTWELGHEPGSMVALAPMPQWLLDIVSVSGSGSAIQTPTSSEASQAAPKASKLPSNGQHPYALAALAFECGKVEQAASGGRNDQLNKSALRVAQLAASCDLNEKEAQDALEQAAHSAGLTKSEIRPTIESGWKKGLANPRECPDRKGYDSIYDPIPLPTPADFAEQEARRERRFWATLKTAADTVGRIVPEREYLIDGWLPIGCVSTLFGDGGLGKSLVAMEMAAAVASGKPLWDCLTTKAPVFAIYCEDDEDELARRQQAIGRSLNLDTDDQREYFYQSRFGMDSSLGHFTRQGEWQQSEFLIALREKALALGARLVIIDNINMVFTGEGNDAGQVTRFMSELNRLALDINGAVLLLGHTAKAEGSKFAGSMAWSNASRNRLFLGRPESTQDAAKNPDLRHLTIEKSNYGKSGEILPLLWHYGAFVLPSEVDRDTKETAQQQHDERIFLRYLTDATAAKRHVSAKSKARNYAPRLFAEGIPPMGCPRRTIYDLERAMGRLLTAEKIADDQALGWRTDQRRDAKGLALVADLEPLVINEVIARNKVDDIFAGLRAKG